MVLFTQQRANILFRFPHLCVACNWFLNQAQNTILRPDLRYFYYADGSKMSIGLGSRTNLDTMYNTYTSIELHQFPKLTFLR